MYNFQKAAGSNFILDINQWQLCSEWDHLVCSIRVFSALFSGPTGAGVGFR